MQKVRFSINDKRLTILGFITFPQKLTSYWSVKCPAALAARVSLTNYQIIKVIAKKLPF